MLTAAYRDLQLQYMWTPQLFHDHWVYGHIVRSKSFQFFSKSYITTTSITVNPEIFSVKKFWLPPKVQKLKTQKIIYSTSLSQKERTQTRYLLWQMFNNNSSFHDGNWISIYRVSWLFLALHHLSNSRIPYFFVCCIWCPRMHDSVHSSSMIFYAVANSSNLFPV